MCDCYTLADIERVLGFSSNTLYGLSNNISKHYKSAYIPKHDGTKRKLSIPDVILKRVQRSIADNILTTFPVSSYATAYKKGSNVQSNAAPHILKNKILKLDIDGFFDNITYSNVKNFVFTADKFTEPVQILLTMLCYHQESLPQGAPSSPTITNIIMFDFDERIGAYCKDRNVAYTRYCDDMTFSGDFDHGEIISIVKNELKKLGLFIKSRKTAVVKRTKRQIVTGIVVNEKINLTKDYKRSIRQELYYISKYGLDEHIHRLNISDKFSYVHSLMGRVAFVLQTLPNDIEFLNYKNVLKREMGGIK